MFLLIMLILSVIMITLWEKVISRHDLEALGSCVVGVTTLLCAVAMISYAISLDTIAKLEAFHNTNKFVYEEAVKEFPNSGRAITRDDSTTVITLPYDRIKAILDYNRSLTWYRLYQNNWFIGGFVGKVSPDIEYIMPLLIEKQGGLI